MLQGVLVHPLANLFPMLDGKAFESLKKDIQENGQREPVVFWRGYLIDGRNRWKACEDLDMQVSVTEISADEDPLRIVMGLNVHRRHLTSAHRAVVAAELANLSTGLNKKHAKWQSVISIGDAARMMACSTTSVKKAKFILKNGVPLVWKYVDEGRMSLHHAKRIVEEYPKVMQGKIISGSWKPRFKDGKKRAAAAVSEDDWVQVFLYSPRREDLLFRMLSVLSAQERLQVSNWLWMQEGERNED